MLQRTGPLYQRFTQQIAADIREGKFAIADQMMGGEYICHKDMMDRSDYSHVSWASRPKGEDEWTLTLDLWFFGLLPRVIIKRGPEYFKLKLTKHEHRCMAEIVRAIFAERKAQRKAEKQDYKQKQALAYYA